jgi:hypothetical protein
MESFGKRFQIGSNRPEDVQVAVGELPDRGNLGLPGAGEVRRSASRQCATDLEVEAT